MDRLSANREVVRSNIGYLKGEDLKLSRRETAFNTPSRSLDDPHSAILGYDLLGSLESALSFQGGSFFALDQKGARQAIRKRESKERKTRKTRTEGNRVDEFDGEIAEEILEEVSPVQSEEPELSSDQELVLFTPSSGKPSLLESLIVTADESAYYAVASLFQMVRKHILARCVEYGSKFCVLEKGKRWPVLSSLPKENLELPGAYVPRLKVSYIHREALGFPTMQNLPLILLAHMYDHALGGDNFASLKSPAVHSLYLSCRQRKLGHQFLSGYSESGPVQYFAQSMASYFSPGSNNTLFAKEVLKTIDFSMYEYLSCLFPE